MPKDIRDTLEWNEAQEWLASAVYWRRVAKRWAVRKRGLRLAASMEIYRRVRFARWCMRASALHWKRMMRELEVQ